MNPTVYYAHSKKIYGTKREIKERAFLEKTFMNVCCPNRDIGERGDIEPYLEMVRKCIKVICSEYLNHIGKGVLAEVQEALDKKKPVFCIKRYRANYYLVPVEGVEVFDEYDWKVFYGRLILKKIKKGIKK